MNDQALHSKTLICLLALIILFVTLDLPKTVYGQQAGKSPKPGVQRGGEQFISIDFNNVDINVLIKFIS